MPRGKESLSAPELVGDPPRAAGLVSMARMVAFEKGEGSESRSIARNLDYIA